MKRFFLVIVLAILTMAAIAQEPYKVYCEIVGTGNITGTKVKIEVILAYPVTPTQGMSKDPVYHYILCKKVTSDEQIKEGINLKDK